MTITTDTHQRSTRKPVATLIFWMMVLTLYFTTILVVSMVLPLIQDSLSATAHEVSWIVTVNILAIAVATPLTG